MKISKKIVTVKGFMGTNEELKRLFQRFGTISSLIKDDETKEGFFFFTINFF